MYGSAARRNRHDLRARYGNSASIVQVYDNALKRPSYMQFPQFRRNCASAFPPAIHADRIPTMTEHHVRAIVFARDLIFPWRHREYNGNIDLLVYSEPVSECFPNQFVTLSWSLVSKSFPNKVSCDTT